MSIASFSAVLLATALLPGAQGTTRRAEDQGRRPRSGTSVGRCANRTVRFCRDAPEAPNAARALRTAPTAPLPRHVRQFGSVRRADRTVLLHVQ